MAIFEEGQIGGEVSIRKLTIDETLTLTGEVTAASEITSAGAAVAVGDTLQTALGSFTAAVSLPSGAAVGASGTLAGIDIAPGNLQGTHTGKVVGLNVEAPSAGTFDAFAAIASTGTGMTQATVASGGTSQYLKVYIGGVLHTVLATRA